MWTAGGAGGHGFGSGSGAGFGGAPDVGALAQQYWRAMTDAMRMAGGGAPQDPWRAALDGWTRLAGGTPRNDVADLVERFSAQARQWFGAMQGVAEQFSGRAASAGDIAAAWKQAMGGGQAFGGLFDALGGRGGSLDHFDQTLGYNSVINPFNFAPYPYIDGGGGGGGGNNPPPTTPIPAPGAGAAIIGFAGFAGLRRKRR